MDGTIVAPRRRRFDHEFKRRAVEMMESGERSARQLGKELGVSEWSLCHWRKQYRENAAGAGPTGVGGTSPAAPGALDLAAEVRRLRRKLETVSRSGYYAHSRKPEGLRRRQDADLKEQIEETFRESRHDHPIAPNRLLPAEGIAPVAAEQTWVADITYLQTGEGWHYLAAEMNLASRRIMGWKSAATMESSLVEEAFQKAAFSSAPPRLHHSDRGSQYAAKSFRSLLDAHHVIPSMSRRANCYDNASLESFWSTLKTEYFHAGPPPTRAQADRMIFDYIETFYNTRRLTPPSAINHTPITSDHSSPKPPQ